MIRLSSSAASFFATWRSRSSDGRVGENGFDLVPVKVGLVGPIRQLPVGEQPLIALNDLAPGNTQMRQEPVGIGGLDLLA